MTDPAAEWVRGWTQEQIDDAIRRRDEPGPVDDPAGIARRIAELREGVMTGGDLAAQRARMDEFGWIPEGSTVNTTWGEIDVGTDVYACPRCGGLVADDWRVTHMDHHGESDRCCGRWYVTASGGNGENTYICTEPAGHTKGGCQE